MVPVLAVMVALEILVAQSQAVAALPVTVQLVEPSVKVFVPEPVAKVDELTDWLFVSNVPLVKVTAPVVDKASWSCQVPPTPLKVRALAKDFPLEVMVFVPEVAAKVTAAVLLLVIPDERVRLP